MLHYRERRKSTSYMSNPDKPHNLCRNLFLDSIMIMSISIHPIHAHTISMSIKAVAVHILIITIKLHFLLLRNRLLTHDFRQAFESWSLQPYPFISNAPS
jgi:hypothetical protein